VFYHLGELDSALTYALGAGAHFNVDEQSEYVQTLIGEHQQQHCQHVPLSQSVAERRLPPVALAFLHGDLVTSHRITAAA
jgi:hypothetical protein